MNFIQSSYENALKQNEDREKFWVQNKNSLEGLQNNLIVYNESLNPVVLVPVCNRVMIRGHLIHTNEILVSLGCSYFTKCSSKQAQDIIQHRLSRADLHLKELEKEKLFLNNQLEQSKNVFFDDSQEIMEPFDEQREKEWKHQHILNVRNWKKRESSNESDIKHEDIMNKLELLELEEEIEQLHNQDFTNTQSTKIHPAPEEQNASANCNSDQQNENISQKIESRISAIRKRLLVLKQSKTKCNSEDDVMKRLDQLQEEEELKDELESLGVESDMEDSSEDGDDSTDTEVADDEYDNSIMKLDIESKQKPKRKISFADETKSRETTALLNFSHSDTPVTKTDFTGKLKSPSDIYTAFPDCFKKETKSIIKNSHRVREEIHNVNLMSDLLESQQSESEKNTQPSILIGDIIEHSKTNDAVKSNFETEKSSNRPVSKFKSMRMSGKQSKYSS